MSDEVLGVQSPKKIAPKKFTYFSGIVYEDNLKIFEYFKSVNYFQWVSAFHDRDQNEDGSPKKPHYHILFKGGFSCSVESMKKTFSGFFANDYIEGVSYPDMLMLYFLHQTPECYLDQTKYKYDRSILFGDPDLIRRIKQNTHFVQLRDFLFYARKGSTIGDALLDLEDDPERLEDMLDYLEKHSYAVGLVTGQELARFRNERNKE